MVDGMRASLQGRVRYSDGTTATVDLVDRGLGLYTWEIPGRSFSTPNGGGTGADDDPFKVGSEGNHPGISGFIWFGGSQQDDGPKITTTPGLVGGKIIPRPIPKKPVHPVIEAYKQFLNSEAVKDCRVALAKIKLWDKIVASVDTVPIIDVDPIANDPASKYFGIKPETANLDLGTFVGSHAKTRRGSNTGIYVSRGLWAFDPTENPTNLFLFLHEHSHYLQPLTGQASQNLDKSLAGALGVVMRAGDSDFSGALNRYFNSGCSKGELGK
jgi:hypothetical protein